jgi:hypothetical protein
MKRIIIIMVIAGLLGCAGTGRQNPRSPLSKSRALELAVALANEKCLAQFKHAPFDTTSYAIIFREDRWCWGSLDLAGYRGYSANVTFDAWGENRRVEVYLSTDQLVPNSRPPTPDVDNDRRNQ